VTSSTGPAVTSLSEPLRLTARPRLVAMRAGLVTLASAFDGSLKLYRFDGLSWVMAQLTMAGLSSANVLDGRFDQNFRVIGVETSSAQRLVAFELSASFGAVDSPGDAVRLGSWSVVGPPNESVVRADFPVLSRDSQDSGDRGGRGFVVTRNSSMVAIWPFGWETAQGSLFSEAVPVSQVPGASFGSIVSDSRWFDRGAGVVHRHGVIVRQYAGNRQFSDLYLPND